MNVQSFGHGIYTNTFGFLQGLYSGLIRGWFSKWNIRSGWEGFMCKSGTPCSFLSGERHLIGALCTPDCTLVHMVHQI